MFDPAQSDPLLLWTIDKLEQSKVVLRAECDEEAQVLGKIEEAIAAGHQLLRSRSQPHPSVANVIPLHPVRRAG
ncbi:hypothetical protein [Devosia sp. RR2S18]|uniref:hypothetical protein n=1 Tax=Devosia rhizosphaerae TaxID=3049774 RepID=UPI00253FB2CE|nr:hypothetical protein [Devosia sp. RR2S18]WIJ24525.1 hypothetical protein QOV41_16120 [Devosia sp. RR2S18]